MGTEALVSGGFAPAHIGSAPAEPVCKYRNPHHHRQLLVLMDACLKYSTSPLAWAPGAQNDHCMRSAQPYPPSDPTTHATSTQHLDTDAYFGI